MIHTSGYFFGPLAPEQLPAYQEELRTIGAAAAVRGTILLTPEGMNIMLAGPIAGIRQLQAHLTALVTRPILFKDSTVVDYPFQHLRIKIKKEVITFHAPVPSCPAPALDVHTFKRWLDAGQDDDGRPVVVFDVRNDYEVAFGTFENAMACDIATFKDFPTAVQRLAPDLFEGKTVVTICTGGIRCEKAAPFLAGLGIPAPVYQLEGGILYYLTHYQDSHWQGECFVFDARTAVDAAQNPTGTVQCLACRHPVSSANQAHAQYIPMVSCPTCAVSAQ